MSPTSLKQHFEAELNRRGIAFSIDQESGRYQVMREDWSMLVSLDNLQREFSLDGDLSRVSGFVDSLLKPIEEPLLSSFYPVLEPCDYAEAPEFARPVSKVLQLVLCYLTSNEDIGWVNEGMLKRLEISPDEGYSSAFANLDLVLEDCRMEFEEIGGVKLGFLNTTFPSKASLIFAPGFRQLVEPILGWPVLAVLPDRDFLYLWSAEHQSFAGRLGSTVVTEYQRAGWPLSTEVFVIDDQGVRAIGAFPIPQAL